MPEKRSPKTQQTAKKMDTEKLLDQVVHSAARHQQLAPLWAHQLRDRSAPGPGGAVRGPTPSWARDQVGLLGNWLQGTPLSLLFSSRGWRPGKLFVFDTSFEREITFEGVNMIL